MTAPLLITPLKSWLPFDSRPLVVSGPCSAESEKQVRETALALAKIPQVKVFRAGIWKPRTRPSAFEGVGKKGLKWLQKVRQDTGLLLTVEVASASHVQDALEYDIDILWIGARTVVNPFSIQEIAEALQGHDIPLMIKNPLNPDLHTWTGAIERFNQMGIKKLVAIHRGFSFFNRSPYRNAPMWEIPIELMCAYPKMPILCDPSHICGNRDLILPTSQKAMDLEMTGLMVETHYRPEEALTDKRQQITPARLEEILQTLIIRKETGSPAFKNKLEGLRSEIDKLDEELIDILARRMSVVEEIGRYKKENRITILQLKRWNKIIRDRVENGIRLGLNRDFILRLLENIHDESIQKQMDVMNRRDSSK
ncbi:MAG: chorismate mutase [Bacteroidales bacterium]